MDRRYEQVSAAVYEELTALKESGYMLPDNEDNETSVAIMCVQHKLAQRVMDIMQPDQFVYINQHYYRIMDIEALSNADGSGQPEAPKPNLTKKGINR